MAEDLEGKVAIVTGGNYGIGKAVVLALAAKGAKVVIDYVADEQATEDLERKIAGLGERSVGIEADVSKVEDLQRMVDTAVSTYGRLDVMVNRTRGSRRAPRWLDTTEAQFEKVKAVNLKSAFFGTQLAAKQMIKQGGGGRIINMTLVHEDWPMPSNTPYCLFKGGMRMLTRTAGRRTGPPQRPRDRRRARGGEHADQRVTVNDPAALAKLDSAIPIGRLAEPEEIASVVAFLAGDGASYITATTIFADGGIMQSSPGL